MATTIPRFYFPPSPSGLEDLLAKFHRLIEKLKDNHEEEMRVAQRRLTDLEEENRRLRAEREPHSIFNIDYMPSDSSSSHELEAAKKQIDVLQKTLSEQYIQYEDMKSKYSLQRLMNDNQQQQTGSSADGEKVKELEAKLEQVKIQVNQFDQCHYESDEQIRLLKELLFHDRPVSHSHTVKQSDLFQQTNIVENLLQKQQEKILNKLEELLDPNPRLSAPNSTARKSKKKRL